MMIAAAVLTFLLPSVSGLKIAPELQKVGMEGSSKNIEGMAIHEEEEGPEGIFLDYEDFDFFSADKHPYRKVLSTIIGDSQFGTNCPDSASPKVAVCFAGLSRRFVAPSQVEYFKSTLLEPIKASGAKGLKNAEGADVFVHTKCGNFSTVAKTRSESGHDVSNPKEFVEATVRELGAVDSVVEEGWGDSFSRSKLGNPSCFHPHGPVEAVMSYFKSINGCLDLINKTETSLGQKYDFVIFSRPDHQEVEGNHELLKRAIQCDESFYIRDAVSYNTRAAWDTFANIWNTQFQSLHPSMCKMHSSYETFVQKTVSAIPGAKSIR